MTESLSDKRRRAGRLGAAARWGSRPRGGLAWYRIVNQAEADAAEVYIYDEISLWGVTAQDFVDELNAVAAGTLNVYINSPGGDVFDGLAILNALRRHPATVRVTVDGLAASAASFVAMAGDEIVMSRNSQMMIHDAHGLSIGQAEDMRAFAELLDKTSQNIASIYAAAAAARGGSSDPEQWRELMRAETWMTAQEAVDLGLADRVAGAQGDTARSARRPAAARRRPAARLARPAATFDPALFRKALRQAFREP